jgi:hypothetical protein
MVGVKIQKPKFWGTYLLISLKVYNRIDTKITVNLFYTSKTYKALKHWIRLILKC